MVYHASFARLNPFSIPFDAPSGNRLGWPDGVLASLHAWGAIIFIEVWLLSKSSRFVVASPSVSIPLGEPGANGAISPCTVIFDGALVSINGIASTALVR